MSSPRAPSQTWCPSPVLSKRFQRARNISRFTGGTTLMFLMHAAFTAQHCPQWEASLVSTSKVLSSQTSWKWPAFVVGGQDPGLSFESKVLSVTQSKLILLDGLLVKRRVVRTRNSNFIWKAITLRRWWISVSKNHLPELEFRLILYWKRIAVCCKLLSAGVLSFCCSVAKSCLTLCDPMD